jgi:hypothetical protein
MSFEGNSFLSSVNRKAFTFFLHSSAEPRSHSERVIENYPASSDRQLNIAEKSIPTKKIGYG